MIVGLTCNHKSVMSITSVTLPNTLHSLVNKTSSCFYKLIKLHSSQLREYNHRFISFIPCHQENYSTRVTVIFAIIFKSIFIGCRDFQEKFCAKSLNETVAADSQSQFMWCNKRVHVSSKVVGFLHITRLILNIVILCKNCPSPIFNLYGLEFSR